MFRYFIFYGGIALAVLTGLSNLGIIAIDDYLHGFANMIPAQAPLNAADVFGGIHPILPKLLLRALAQVPYSLGVADPFWQLRIALGVLGAIVFLIQFYAARVLFGLSREGDFAAFMLAFYFALPLFSTRPMIETVCMPLLTLSGAYAARYGRGDSRAYLLLALLFVVLASLMRFQAGVCFFVLPCLVFWQKRREDWGVFLLCVLGAFVLSGLPDVLYRGQFHGQLREYIRYNMAFSGEHFGRMPFYVFFVLAFALTLPPAFLSRYQGMDWKKTYRGMGAVLGYVLVFLVAHSLSPHKEDRFIVPVLPLLLFSLVPMAVWLWDHGSVWRRWYFLGLNGFLLLLTCTNVPQKNLIGLAAWLSSHPEVRQVDYVNQSLIFHPQAFLVDKRDWNSRGGWKEYENTDCSRPVVVRSDISIDETWHSRFREITRFEPGWIERALVRANPKNARRGPLVLYIPRSCGS